MARIHSGRQGIGRPLLLALTLVIVAIVAVGCSSTTTTTTAAPGGETTAAPPTTAAAGGGGTAVTLENFAFSPATVTVKVGDTVTWTNNDSATHNVTADDGSFKSPDFGQGGTFSFTFQKAGTYTYGCTIHPQMKGTVVVQ